MILMRFLNRENDDSYLPGLLFPAHTLPDLL